MKRTLLFYTIFALQSAALLAGQVTIKGSDTMVILTRKWAEEYMRLFPGINIEVTGGGSGTGLAALQNGTTDIATSSRPMKSKEIADFVIAHGTKPVEIRTALDGLGVYVHSRNPVNELTLAQIGAIFTGGAKNWNQLGGPEMPFVLYSRENNSGTYGFFKEHVLKDKDFASSTQYMPGTAGVINAIAKDLSGVGYGGIGYAKGVKALAIRADEKSPAFLPDSEHVLSGQYPLSRYLFFYANPKKTTDEIRKFVDWVRGPQGQKVVATADYYPLPGSATVATGDAPAPNAVASAAAAAISPSAPAMATPSAASSVAVIESGAGQLSREELLTRREKLVAEREALVAIREAQVAAMERRQPAQTAAAAR